jgi:uncharacterized iron-regulated protein
MSKKVIPLLFLGLAVVLSAGRAAAQGREDKSLLLDLGEKRFRGRTMDIRPGLIFSAENGKPVSLARMVEELAACRFVYIGETHNSLPMHEIQAAVIRALFEKDRRMAVGLEMYPVTDQEPLTRWSLGILTEKEFLDQGQWYINWNFNFGYYRPVFEYVKEMRISLRGLNVPRDIITRVRMGGYDSLSEEQKKLVPPLDLSNADHRKLIRTILENAEIPHEMKGPGMEMMFEGLYRAQVAWDTVMAANARKAAEVEDGRVVVLAGSGHLLYNLGINFRVWQRNRQPFKTIICVEVPAGRPGLKVSRGLADFVWGLPAQDHPAYPDIGLSFKKVEGLGNLVVERKPIDGAARAADFDKGDIILSVDGKAYSDVNTLRTYLAGFSWGQEVKFRTLRSGATLDVVLRLVPAGEEGGAK